MFTKFPQITERIKAGSVPVGPGGLDGVTADDLVTFELKTGRCECPLWTVHMSHDVRFALAYGAGACFAEGFELDKRLHPIVPCDGQLLSNMSNLKRSDAGCHAKERENGRKWDTFRAGVLTREWGGMMTYPLLIVQHIAGGWAPRFSRARTKQGGADSDQCSTFFDGDSEIITHSHGEMSQWEVCFGLHACL